MCLRPKNGPNYQDWQKSRCIKSREREIGTDLSLATTPARAKKNLHHRERTTFNSARANWCGIYGSTRALPREPAPQLRPRRILAAHTQTRSGKARLAHQEGNCRVTWIFVERSIDWCGHRGGPGGGRLHPGFRRGMCGCRIGSLIPFGHGCGAREF